MIPVPEPAVAAVLASYPRPIRNKLMRLRALIFETAAATEGVGTLTETLKWGEPAYLTAASRSGSTIRIGWKQSDPDHYALYFHCQTNLVETFRTLFPRDFVFLGNRGLLFEHSSPLPVDAVAVCIEAALTYHRNRRKARNR